MHAYSLYCVALCRAISRWEVRDQARAFNLLRTYTAMRHLRAEGEAVRVSEQERAERAKASSSRLALSVSSYLTCARETSLAANA